MNDIMASWGTNPQIIDIEPQLMTRFLEDNHASMLSFPDEFAETFSPVLLSDKMAGSLLDTMTTREFKLPTKCTRGFLDSDEIDVVKVLYNKLHPFAPNTQANSIVLQYSTVVFQGKTYGSCGKGTLTSKSCVAIAMWDTQLYGQPPTALPLDSSSSAGLSSVHRPVKVHRYIKATFSETGNFPSELILAQVSWLYPLQHRFAIGKPAELWCRDMFENFGIHAFVPVSNLVHRCAYAPFLYQSNSALVIIPLVE